MRVRCFWRDCTYRNRTWGSPPVDAFWVEATEQEARSAVFPLLKPEQVAESRKVAEQYHHAAVDPARPFCYLVARDLSSIDPFHPHYPFHQLWNAYSPFESMSEITVSTLDALLAVVLPSLATEIAEDTAEPDRDADPE